MKVIKIEKKTWSEGLDKSRSAFRLIGPVKDKGKSTSQFKFLEEGEEPDLTVSSSTLSPKCSNSLGVLLISSVPTILMIK